MLGIVERSHCIWTNWSKILNITHTRLHCDRINVMIYQSNTKNNIFSLIHYNDMIQTLSKLFGRFG